MGKVTFKSVAPNSLNIGGVYVQKKDLNTKGPLYPIDYYLSGQQQKREARKYLKGLRKVFKASQYKGFCEGVAESYTGNFNTTKSKFDKLRRELNDYSIMELADNDKVLAVTSYVDGSYSCYVASRY